MLEATLLNDALEMLLAKEELLENTALLEGTTITLLEATLLGELLVGDGALELEISLPSQLASAKVQPSAAIILTFMGVSVCF